MSVIAECSRLIPPSPHSSIRRLVSIYSREIFLNWKHDELDSGRNGKREQPRHGINLLDQRMHSRSRYWRGREGRGGRGDGKCNGHCRFYGRRRELNGPIRSIMNIYWDKRKRYCTFYSRYVLDGEGNIMCRFRSSSTSSLIDDWPRPIYPRYGIHIYPDIKAMACRKKHR